MQQHSLKKQEIRALLQKARLEINDYLTEQERRLRMMYEGMKERLDKIQHAVVACNGSGGPIPGNSSNFLGAMDHTTPIFTRYGDDAQSGAVGNCITTLSTPPNRRMQFIVPDVRAAKLEGIPQGIDRSDWTALTLSSRLQGTPAVSPHNHWTDDELAQRERNNSVDYTCFETLDKLMNEEDMQHGNVGTAFAFCADDDDVKHSQQSYSLMSHNATPEIAHVAALSLLQNQHLTTSLKVMYVNGRPRAVPVADGLPDEPAKLGIDVHAPCKVLVEFKRKRVLQFESKEYVPPGSYVMVGGDRGEDLGLVTYTWCETTKGAKCDVMDAGNGGVKPGVLAVGLSGSTLTRSIGLGTGTVLRLATESDVTQLHTVQVELERRAIDVCSQRVLERGLPMTIVDAEYQFDKNKLTFFYEAQQRMDFRELVRDLYKTFRARIWMEVVEN